MYGAEKGNLNFNVNVKAILRHDLI